MYYLDRLTLGKQLAGLVPSLKGSESIIVCLKESSLLTAVSMAIDLRAWIFPLEFEAIKDPRDESKLLGAITVDGEFCLNPDVSQYEFSSIQQDFFGIVEDRKREAMSRLNARVAADAFDKHCLNGRPVILLGDILSSTVEMAVADSLLKPLAPNGLYGIVGNATFNVSDRMNMETTHSTVLDVLANIMDDDHYFEQRDAYSSEEKRQLARNVQTYWA